MPSLETLNSKLVEEIPLVITLNDIHFSVMLVSPYDLEDFIFGYLRSELIIQRSVDIHDIALENVDSDGVTPLHIKARVTLANRCIDTFKQRQRKLKGASGCGMCGKEVITDAFPTLDTLSLSPTPNLQHLSTIRTRIPQWQHLGQHSGALHGAFWVDSSGEITISREDIGRHNAMDKLLGALQKAQQDLSSGTLVITSRCGAELVQKAIIARVSCLASLASPSAMALSLANQYKLHLVHIPKHDRPYMLTGPTS